MIKRCQPSFNHHYYHYCNYNYTVVRIRRVAKTRQQDGLSKWDKGKSCRSHQQVQASYKGNQHAKDTKTSSTHQDGKRDVKAYKITSRK